jgi:hypothetical protein
MKRLVFLTMLSIGVMAPCAIAAQDEMPRERATSLSLRPFGETTVGLWHRVSTRLELGLEAGASTREEEAEDDPYQRRDYFTVEPAAKLYGTPRGTLQPYGIASVYAYWQREKYAEDLQAHSSAIGTALGVGLEWSPVARIRIGGHAGVRAAMLDGERVNFEGLGPVRYDVDGWEASTFTSGLTFYYSF